MPARPDKKPSEDDIEKGKDKVEAAYALIDSQVSHNVIPVPSRKAALASKYAKQYTAKQMRFATQQLEMVGKAVSKSVDSNVRIQRRSASIASNPTTSDGIDSECLFA